jgi:hypothetical protein
VLNKFDRALRLSAMALLMATGLVVTGLPLSKTSSAGPLPQGGSQGSGFLGAWCVQGDSTKQASITANGAFFNLTNESGSTSIGHLQGMQQNVLIADEWQFVQGALSPDGSRISWSNGTFWARCNSSGGGGGGHRPNIDGTWYRSADHSQACYIKQRGKNLKLTNEAGSSATGSIDGKRHVTTNWNGTTIAGTLTASGDRINWDNGTYWTR